MANYYYGELCYVKVRRIVGGTSGHVWCGWLGLGSKDGYASYINSESTLPPQDRVLAVQWVGESNDGSQPDQDTTQGPRYLRAINYPGGAHFLGGSGQNGFYCYFWPEDNGGPGDSYLLTLVPLPNSNECLVRRASDNGPVYTYDDYYMGYWKSGNEFEITFEFIPAAHFSTTYENWMRDQSAHIGSRHISEIAIPGSHDAGCSRITRPLGNLTSQTQGLEIYDQLMHGSRYFDLRAWLDDNDVWRIYHGKDWSTVTLQNAVDQLDLFLSAHPQEVVLLSLLLEGKPGIFDAKLKKAWQLMFDKLHRYHLNYQESQNAPPRDFSVITPSYLAGLGKNLLIFSWGNAQSWSYTTSDGQEIFVSPWSSGRHTNMDLDGVFVDDATATATDIIQAYLQYTPQPGRCWILHTNTPWQFKAALDSLYAKHVRNTPGLAGAVQGLTIVPPRANIINIDYVGDTVTWSGGVANLVKVVIESNLNFAAAT
jgi:hypothetical protein